MKLIYVWDAICGWCYGFESVLTKFVQNHPELELKMVSGGLITGDRIKPIREYSYIKNSNAQISQIYGVEFSDAYNAMLDEGSTVLNSNQPGLVFSVLREVVPSEKWVDIGWDMQKLMYLEGKSLSNFDAYKAIFEKYGIATKIIEKIRANWNDTTIPENDFNQARELGVSSYPTLLIEHDGKYFDIRTGTETLEELEDNYQKVLTIQGDQKASK